MKIVCVSDGDKFAECEMAYMRDPTGLENRIRSLTFGNFHLLQHPCRQFTQKRRPFPLFGLRMSMHLSLHLVREVQLQLRNGEVTLAIIIIVTESIVVGMIGVIIWIGTVEAIGVTIRLSRRCNVGVTAVV